MPRYLPETTCASVGNVSWLATSWSDTGLSAHTAKELSVVFTSDESDLPAMLAYYSQRNKYSVSNIVVIINNTNNNNTLVQ